MVLGAVSNFSYVRSRIFGQGKCCYFWKSHSFYNTSNRFKIFNFLTIRGLSTSTPCQAVVAFKWSLPLRGRYSPLEKILGTPLVSFIQPQLLSRRALIIIQSTNIFLLSYLNIIRKLCSESHFVCEFLIILESLSSISEKSLTKGVARGERGVCYIIWKIC